MKNKNEIQIYSDNNFSLSYRESDNYVNATEMCKLAGKKWAHYRENGSTQEFLNKLSLNVGIPIFKLIDSKKGKYGGGTYVHELIAYNLAQWCSAEVAIFVAKLLQSIRQGKILLLENQLNWKKQRFEAKDSNKLLNQAIQECINPESNFPYINESKAICKIVTGYFPCQIRKSYGVKEARDVLSTEDLADIDFLQRCSCTLMHMDLSFAERKEQLVDLYENRKVKRLSQHTINNL